MEIRYAYNDFNAQDGPESEADMAGRKQRTPQEIEDEMNEQDQEQAEEVEEEEEEEEESDEEESDEEDGDEEDDGEEESTAEDESDMLIENYGAFLCLGYSPAQIDKHLPKLIADTAAARKSHTKDMAGSIGEELAQAVQDGYDEYFLPAFQEWMKHMREQYGNDLVKLKRATDWMTARLLREVGKYHVDHLTGFPWPKPENG